MSALFFTKKVLGTFLVFVCLIGSTTLFAWPFELGKRRVHTVIVTGNYEKPRLLADLVQFSTNQPYILLPRSDKGKLYFCPVKSDQVLTLDKDDLDPFLVRVRPRQVIILGDKRFVSKEYETLLKRHNIVVRIQGNDWNKIAITLSQLLGAKHVPANFKRLVKELDEKRKQQSNVFVAPKSETVSKKSDLVTVEASSKESTGERLESKPVTEQTPALIEDTHPTIK